MIHDTWTNWNYNVVITLAATLNAPGLLWIPSFRNREISQNCSSALEWKNIEF